MSTLTIRLPDVTALSLQDLAHTRGPGINKLMEELSSVRLKVEQIQLVSGGQLNGLGAVSLQGA